MLDKITPVILTLDEAPNVARTLEVLQWAKEVVVLDSGSTDGTTEVARRFPNVRVWTRTFDSHARQWNAAVGDPQIKTDWVLALDADYLVTPSLVAELAALSPPELVSGYCARFEFALGGTLLRGSLYPPHVVLFRRGRGDGAVEQLTATIIHDDRKPMGRWLASQRGYALHEAERLRALSWSQSSMRDRVRKMLIIAPWAVPAYALFGQGVVLDGWSGLRYGAQRALAEVFIAHALLRTFLGRRSHG